MKRFVVLALVVSAPAAQEEKKEKPKARVLAVRGARVYTLAGTAIENATILVENGKISAVGADVKVPEGAEVIDATGKVVIPGLVDGASRLFTDGSDYASGGSPEQDACDLLDPYDENAKEAIRNGVTTVCVLPMGRGPMSGLGVVVRPGADRKHWVLKRHACLRLSLGTGGADMSTSFHRNEVYRQLRGAFEGAKQYQEMWEKYKKDLAEYKQKKKQWDDQQKKKEAKKDGEKKDGEKKEEKPGDKKEGDSELKEEPKKPQKPRVDPRNEVLVRAIDPKTQLLVRIEAHTADTVDWALELARDYKLRIAVDCGTEAARVAAALAQAKVPVFVGPVFRYGLRRVDYLNHSIDTAAELSKAGVTIAIASFPDPAAGHEGAGATRFLLEAAAFAAGKGLSRDQALRAVTLEPAKILGIDATVGSIEKGKAADLVILSGEPFEPGTRVERTMCDGAWIYQAKIE